MNPETKKLIKNYLELTFWYSCNQDNKTLTVEQFETVLKEIGNLEDQLLATGLKDEQIAWLIKFSSDIASKSLDQYTNDELIGLFVLLKQKLDAIMTEGGKREMLYFLTEQEQQSLVKDVFNGGQK